MTGEFTIHTTPKERNGAVCPSYINYHLKSEASIMLRDAPIIGLLIGSVADMTISTISIIGTNALQTDNWYGKNIIICNVVTCKRLLAQYTNRNPIRSTIQREAIQVQMKVILPHRCLGRLRLAFGRCFFMEHTHTFVVPTIQYCMMRTL